MIPSAPENVKAFLVWNLLPQSGMPGLPDIKKVFNISCAKNHAIPAAACYTHIIRKSFLHSLSKNSDP